MVDEQNLIEEIPEDQRLVFILRTIANTDMDGIKIEAEYPSKNENKKMANIDMEAWMEGGNVFYQHYEKPVSSKAILNAQSVQSPACKRSVHTM